MKGTNIPKDQIEASLRKAGFIKRLFVWTNGHITIRDEEKGGELWWVIINGKERTETNDLKNDIKQYGVRL